MDVWDIEASAPEEPEGDDDKTQCGMTHDVTGGQFAFHRCRASRSPQTEPGHSRGP